MVHLSEPDAGLGPLVPPELVPAVEQPARPAPAHPIAVAAVVVAVLAVLIGSGLGVRSLYENTLLTTAVLAIEAASNDDIRTLEGLVLPETASTPAFKAALGRTPSPAGYRFSKAVRHEGIVVTFEDARGESGSMTLRPVWRAFGEASLDWTGPPFGTGSGRVVASLEPDGWRVLLITVGKAGVSFLPEDAERTFGNVGR